VHTEQGHRELEHTADWALEVWASDLAALLAESARGMYGLMGVVLADGRRQRRQLELAAADRESLLVDFLPSCSIWPSPRASRSTRSSSRRRTAGSRRASRARRSSRTPRTSRPSPITGWRSATPSAGSSPASCSTSDRRRAARRAVAEEIERPTMVELKDLRRISDHEWEIPTSVRADMRVPVRVFASRALLEAIGGDSSLEQAVNATTLPGVIGRVLVMPTSTRATGPDRRCRGHRAAARRDLAGRHRLRHQLRRAAARLERPLRRRGGLDRRPRLRPRRRLPERVGTGGRLKLDERELERVCREGGEWARRRGYGTESDVARTEEGGVLAGADFATISHRARDRGRTQVGTLGAGNHFIEVEVVDEVFDAAAARVMGLEEGLLTVLIHCGSRGFGHQVCTDYVKSFQSAVERYRIRLPDRELVCAPLDSPRARPIRPPCVAPPTTPSPTASCWRTTPAAPSPRRCAAAPASPTCTRSTTSPTTWARPRSTCSTAFGAGSACTGRRHPRLRPRLRGPAAGVPRHRPAGAGAGQHGHASWVLVGTEGSMERSLGSCCHGAGRTMSRSRAKRTIHGGTLRQELEARGIRIRAGSLPGLAEEAPAAYKDVDAVVDAVEAAGIARKVARLRPVAVVKG